MSGQLEKVFFPINSDPPFADDRRAYLDPTNPVSPYFGFVGNKRAVDKLIRIDFEALGRYNHCCSDLNVAFLGQAGCGKAQPLDSIVYTPHGPKQMGDVKVGEVVCTPSGKNATIIGVFPQGEKQVFRIHFNDGTFAECCKQHLWLVNRVGNTWKNSKILDTAYLIENCKTIKGRRKFSIPVTKPVNFTKRKVKIHPYSFGILLGDGNFTNSTVRFSTADKFILNSIKNELPANYKIIKDTSKKYDYRIVKSERSNATNIIMEALRQYGLWGKYSDEKFVPEDYMFNSIENRIELLNGLMDSDGYANKENNSVWFYSTSLQLMHGVKFLVESIGGTCRINSKKAIYKHKGKEKTGKLCYVCSIQTNDPTILFKLKRKKNAIHKRTKYFVKRIIDRIEYVGDRETQCILLDSKDHLYLTDNFIVTHNTELARRHAHANKLPYVEISPKAIKNCQDLLVEIARVCAAAGLPLVELGRAQNYWIPPCNVFIDEVHALAPPVVQGLLKATEYNDAILVTDKGYTADCKRVHWLIATTDRGKLFDAFDTRFSKVILNLYTKEEIAQIVHFNNPEWGLDICRLVAHYCGRIPREALAFAREMKLEHNMHSDLTWRQVGQRIASDNEIDEFGMSYKRLAILKALGHGPIAEKRLPLVIGVKVEELDKFILPWLVADTDDQPALVGVCNKGYCLTDAGITELKLRKLPYKEAA